MIALCAWECPVTDATSDCKIDIRTGIDIYPWPHEVCTTKLLQTPIVLGGAGVVVQIDESLFRQNQRLFNITA